MRLMPHIAMSSTAGPEETLITTVVQQLHIQSTWTWSVAKDRTGGMKTQRNYKVFWWILSVKLSYFSIVVKDKTIRRENWLSLSHTKLLSCPYLRLAHKVWKRRTGSILHDRVTGWMKLSAQTHHAEKDSTCPQRGFCLDISRKIYGFKWLLK